MRVSVVKGYYGDSAPWTAISAGFFHILRPHIVHDYFKSLSNIWGLKK